jgi:protocatechuate 3,4-dioxygenase alpha subunit
VERRLTPLQPTGPYPEAMLDLPRGTVAVGWSGARGTRITIEGRLLDGAGAPIADALVEIWQADAEGRYPHEGDPRAAEADPEFWGYARVATEDSGRFQFDTIKPGAVGDLVGDVVGDGVAAGVGASGAPGVAASGAAGAEDPAVTSQAPHILISVCGTGILTRYTTRLYFDDEPANAADPILLLVPADRRATLLARTIAPRRYQFDIVLQGEGETVFFDL